MSLNNGFFCVLHAPYIEGETARWSILSYQDTESSAIKYALGITAGISVGDLIAVVFIDDITNLANKCRWLGIAHVNNDGDISVIRAPYGLSYISGKFWIDAYYEDKYNSYTLLRLTRKIPKLNFVKIMMACVNASFKEQKYRDMTILNQVNEMVESGVISDREVFDMMRDCNSIKMMEEYKASGKQDYYLLALMACLDAILKVTLVDFFKSEDMFMSELKVFCNSCSRMNDEIEDGMCEIIKDAVPMPVAILSHIGQKP